ncbi:conserved hypothetical protein [uncultured Defluviicoccus sp.]|uniref:Uncharacterized protein n=1 Tax=metagenome TaxID=256318 RepID=A0A380TC84_9ZZZZ|nr:conserved hypothetical protein [uncultured Defluviicoccus sp.]
MNASLALIISAALFAAPQKVPLGCPERIETRQELVSTADGWHVSTSTPNKLETGNPGTSKHWGHVSGFSRGLPEEMVILAPYSSEESSRSKGISVNAWRVNTSAEGQVSYICTYASTAIQLSKSLPAGLTWCYIEYDRVHGASHAWCE